MYFNIEKVNINLGKRIMLIADIHYYHTYNVKILDGIVEKAKELKPDYICIAGDILDTQAESKHPNTKMLYAFFESLTHIAPLLVVIGNHDIAGHKATDRVMPTKFLNKIKHLDNVFLLNNNGLTFDNITFYGYNASHDYYRSRERNTKLLEKEFNIKTHYNYNILVTHSPINLLDDSVYNAMRLDRFKLVLCGHMHNGLMPHNVPGHMGLIAPSKGLFPKNARGVINHDKTTFVITGGVVKLSHSAKILSNFNNLFPVSITIIE